MTSISTTQLPHMTTAVAILERAGWTIVGADLDLVRETLRLELRRDDMLVTFDARHGRATTTRERVRSQVVVVGRRGDKCPVERLRTEFVGRQQHEGIRSGLRWLTSYIAENSVRALPVADVRRAFAPILGGGR